MQTHVYVAVTERGQQQKHIVDTCSLTKCEGSLQSLQGKQVAKDCSDYSTQEIIYFVKCFIAASLSQVMELSIISRR